MRRDLGIILGTDKIVEPNTKNAYTLLFWKFKSLILSNVWETNENAFGIEYKKFLNDYRSATGKEFPIQMNTIL
jgi:hypothetical protein